MTFERESEKQSYIEEVAAYIRVSTTEQKMHGLSLDAQVEKLQRYADENGLKIVEWYKDEGVSGRKLIRKRPELQRMIHDAEKGKFRRIIFIKLDRFFRSVAEYHECMKIIDPVVWTATEEDYDLTTPNGRMLVHMKLTIAEYEADQTGERIRLVNEYKIKNGQPLFGSHGFPFCYKVEQPEDGERHKYIKQCDEEIMYDLIAHVMKHHSVRAAVIYINQKYERTFGYNAIRNTLMNEMICGSYRGNPNYCKPYITREEFDLLQSILKRNPRTSKNEHTYIFTGLIKCPDCGRRLAGSVITNNKRKATYKTYKYYGYRCQKHNKGEACKYGNVIFENRFERELLSVLEGVIEAKKAKIIKLQAEAKLTSKHNVEELQQELDRLNYSWQKGRIKNVEEYDKQYDKLMAKISEANEEQATLNEEPDYEKIQNVLSSGWKEIYMELDAEHKRSFWRTFIDEIHVEWTRESKRIIDIKFL